MQKYMVPWSIVLNVLSFAKTMKVDNIKEMLIAIIDEQQLMQGYPDCVAEAKKTFSRFQ